MEALVPPPIRLTRTNSAALEMTGDGGSRDSIEHEEASTLDSQARESMATEWTDEKHSMYLKSMEASFVDQLYNSSDLLGWRSQDCPLGPRSSRQMHASTRIPSGQFKVLRDGCWERFSFRSDESKLNKADGSHVLSSNPWIRHFRRHETVTSNALQEKAALPITSNQFPASRSHLCHQDSVGSNTEVSDQNFIDEIVEKEKTNRICSTKRMRTSIVASSSNDQVVPFGKFSEDGAENRVSTKE